VADLRARLDACLHGACLKGAWKELPAAFGRADTIHRQFRRWGEAGLWEALLHAVAQQGRDPALAGLAYFVCRAFRRAHRILGCGGCGWPAPWAWTAPCGRRATGCPTRICPNTTT
jgi:transposase